MQVFFVCLLHNRMPTCFICNESIYLCINRNFYLHYLEKDLQCRVSQDVCLRVLSERVHPARSLKFISKIANHIFFSTRRALCSRAARPLRILVKMRAVFSSPGSVLMTVTTGSFAA